MPIRRSPRLTPRSPAARRANALKSTGPRTPCGKARFSLNALKHGRSMGPDGRAPRFRERLLRAGYPYQEALYGDLRSCLAQAFGARSPYWRRQVDQFAASAWCVVMGRNFFRTKLECAFESEEKTSRVLSQDSRKGWVRSLRYRAEDPWRRIGVAFWLQRRRYLTSARAKRMFRGLEPVSLGPANGIGERRTVPRVPAATARLLRAAEIQPRSERRSRLEPAALAEPAALPRPMGSRAAPTVSEVGLRVSCQRLTGHLGPSRRFQN